MIIEISIYPTMFIECLLQVSTALEAGGARINKADNIFAFWLGDTNNELMADGDGCSCNQAGSNGADRKWSNSGCILKVEPAGFGHWC